MTITDFNKELIQVQNSFRIAEQKIINLLSVKKSFNINTINEQEILKQIQKILKDTIELNYKKVPNILEFSFRAGKLSKELMKAPLTPAEQKMLDEMVEKYMGRVLSESIKIQNNIEKLYNDYKLKIESTGTTKMLEVHNSVAEAISNQGLIAYVDKSGKNWNMYSYSNMLLRTSRRQLSNLAVLYTYPHIDLYKISSHNTTCPLCAPYEGRVYSRSGEHPIYPPLSSAFGKIDKNGSNDLSNTYLNIHPNCLHVLIPFIEEGLTDEEIEKERNFSDPKKNPFNVDPRSQKQIEQYHQKEADRAKLMNDYKQFQKYKLALGDKMPSTFNTFLKHKLDGSDKYKHWESLYRNR